MKRQSSGTQLSRKSKLIAAALLLAVLAGSSAFAQSDSRNEDRSGPLHGNWPIKPFKIIGNVYYVGSRGLASFRGICRGRPVYRPRTWSPMAG